MKPEYGFMLRAGFAALTAIDKINSGSTRAVPHGSMVEMSILSFADQTVCDLLNGGKKCYLDKDHHLQGAAQVPISSAQELVQMVAAVEMRITRGTKMNATPSRRPARTAWRPFRCTCLGWTGKPRKRLGCSSSA